MGSRKGSGQTALVTGASGGIGVDLAECFARDGYDLILTARSEDALNAVATHLANAFGVKATAIANDLGAIGGGKSLAEKIKGRGLTVNALVNNAGFGHAGALTAAPVETTLGMIDLNVRALVELTHIYWDEMLKRGRGGVLNVASTAAFQPGPGMATYFATKAFVLSFTEALHEEVATAGIRVTALCPGPTKTEFGDVAGFKGNGAFDKMAAKSEDVVAMGLRALDKGSAVAIPGLFNKVGAQAHRLLPRAWLRKVTGMIKL